jgi:oligopeptidase B
MSSTTHPEAVVPSGADLPAPPVARRVPRPVSWHGDTFQDDYFWLREKSDPTVAAYLEQENAYADAVMKPTAAFQEQLYKEMLGRIQETDLTVPYREGAWWYFSRTEEGKQYPILCRKAALESDEEEVLLDLNQLAEGHAFLSLGTFLVSDDGHLLAYSTDVTGFREYTLVIKDLRTGELLPFKAERSGAVAWALDSKTLFYTVEDDAKRPHRVYRHELGAPRDELVFEDADELFRVFVGRSRSREWLFLGSASHTTTEWHFLNAATPRGAWRVIAPRRHEHEYDPEHHGDHFYIRTNDRGRNFRLVRTPVADPGEASWQEVVPHRDGVMLEAVELFAGHQVLVERERGLEQLRVSRVGGADEHLVTFPEPAYDVFPSNNREFDTTTLRFNYQSMVTPSSVFDYDMDSRERTLLKQQPVLGGYDASLYRSERLLVPARDGVKVPVSIVYRRDRQPRDGSSPLYLYAYGSYGLPLPVGFSSNRLSLLDRGVTVALAHIRGGGELGKPWHDDGRMHRKMNTFTDFIAVAEHLVAEGYTRPDRLAIEGGSAGGLLMGAVVNLRPDLFKVVVSKVPFVDVLNTMSDASLPLTAGEWEEWGNPAVADDYAYMKQYDPYTNLKPGAYPDMLVKTSFHDSQVMYWEPAKYVARLRTLKKDSSVLVLKTNMEAGHGGASGRYDYLREVAFDFAFILTRLGIGQ